MNDAKNGSRLSKFKNLKEIGRGGFGIVYAAERENGGKVAIKKIDRSAAQNRVRAEIQTMKQLNHRNIVEYIEDFIEDGVTYLVMELCEGGSLRAYVKERGALAEPIAVHVLRQLISAVTYMHRYNVLHRDLSAGNVFIKDSSKAKMTIKLGDFGLATSLGRGETACTIVGTPGYIAPQVFRQDYDQAADVYSLGGVLYTMLTARDPPTKGAPSTHGMSTTAAELVEAMMQIDAKKRIQLREIVMTDFMRENTDEEARLYSRESSRDGRRRSKEPIRGGFSSRDGRSQDRRPLARSSSQPAVQSGRALPLSNRPVHDRMPSTSTRTATSDTDRGRERERERRPEIRSGGGGTWPIKAKRLAGQRLRTAGGRYIVEDDTIFRFEVAAKGDIISRILIVEYDPVRREQRVFVHRIAERRERVREDAEDLIEVTRNPMVYSELHQLPHDVLNDYNRLQKVVTTTLPSRVAKITYRRPPQFPDAAAQLMENGDLRIKFSKSLIVRKVDTGEIYNCIEGTRSKREGVHGTTLTKVNEVYEYLTRFEQCLSGMGSLTCFPMVFSAGPNITVNGNNSPSSILPSAASRFAFSNISNGQQSQMPRSAPFLTKPISTRPASTDVVRRGSTNDENAGVQWMPPKFKFKVDAQQRVISIQGTDGRMLRRSTRLNDQFIFTDPSINTGELRFMKTGRIPERAGELLHHLVERIKQQQNS